MANPNGNPSGKPASELTLEHGPREKIDMRWPQKIIARVDRRAAELTLEEGKTVTRTEYALRAVIRQLDEDAVPDAERVKSPAMVAAAERQAAEVRARSDGIVSEQESCLHPKDARLRLGYLTRCGICGKRMDR